jgi:nitroreductase
MSFLDSLSWRQAEKTFDPEKKVSAENLDQILESIRMAPTSYGLQTFHLYVVTNSEFKEKMFAAGYNQQQFLDASHILVFTSKTNVQERIEQYVELASNGNPAIKEKLSGYADMMRGTFANKSTDEINTWAKKQAYIALGFAMAACAELHVDSCPMEGFNASEFNKILNLPDDQDTAVVLPIGHRKEEPHRPKVRFDDEDLFTYLD